MPNVNMADLRSSLRGCVEYCRNHEERDFCQRHLPLLEDALEELVESRKETDEYYAKWRGQRRSHRQAWKSVSSLFAETQQELDRVNAVGYPDQTVRYWDEELLEEVVEEMIEYLEARRDSIESASEYIDKLDRELGKAREELEAKKTALRGYQRRVKKRSDAMAGAAQAIMDFREILEDELGSKHPDYDEIRWPYALTQYEATM